MVVVILVIMTSILRFMSNSESHPDINYINDSDINPVTNPNASLVCNYDNNSCSQFRLRPYKVLFNDSGRLTLFDLLPTEGPEVEVGKTKG